MAPADNFETREAVRAAAQSTETGLPALWKEADAALAAGRLGFELGRASLIREGADLSFLACGETVAPAFEAAELLAKEGIQCRVLSLHTIKPLDQAAVRQAATETGGVITVEEHSVNGGLGEACAGLLLQEGIPRRFKIVGFPDDHTVTGSQEEIFRHYGIDGPGLAVSARNLLAKALNAGDIPIWQSPQTNEGAAESTASAPAARRGASWASKLIGVQGPLIGLVALCVIFSFTTSAFLSLPEPAERSRSGYGSRNHRHWHDGGDRDRRH